MAMMEIREMASLSEVLADLDERNIQGVQRYLLMPVHLRS